MTDKGYSIYVTQIPCEDRVPGGRNTPSQDQIDEDYSEEPLQTYDRREPRPPVAVTPPSVEGAVEQTTAPVTNAPIPDFELRQESFDLRPIAQLEADVSPTAVIATQVTDQTTQTNLLNDIQPTALVPEEEEFTEFPTNLPPPDPTQLPVEDEEFPTETNSETTDSSEFPVPDPTQQTVELEEELPEFPTEPDQETTNNEFPVEPTSPTEGVEELPTPSEQTLECS